MKTINIIFQMKCWMRLLNLCRKRNGKMGQAQLQIITFEIGGVLIIYSLGGNAGAIFIVSPI